MSLKSLTTYQVAKICNVHQTTVINWVKEGKLDAYTTPGGHRRIKREDLVKFVKKFNIPVSDKDIRDHKLVLIVDDDAEARSELKEALSGQGFEMDFASDGFEVGRKVYSHKPDLILLDFMMPGMNGFQVCEVLNSDEETKDIPIFALTVLKSPEDCMRIKNCGVKRYMPKPIDLDKLLKWIKEELEISAHPSN